MQIKELTLPPNQKKITYQICKNGKTNIYTSSKRNQYNLSIDWGFPKIQLGQLNSIQLTQENQLQNILEKNPFQTVKKVEKQKQQTIRKICCSCKKSKCLKMYCECFANKLFCADDCTCRGCTNTEFNSKKLLIIREQFGHRKTLQQRGCRCQRSGCNKKYCQCFSKNLKCGQLCECLNCSNVDRKRGKIKKQELIALKMEK